MTVEVRPLGDQCNIACRYCYQDKMRVAGELPTRYSVSRMLETLARLDEPFAIFGGEALLVRDADLKSLFSFGQERFGAVAIQTNGTLIEERHITLFERHKVRVGISLDGPGAFNDLRWAGSLAATRRATARTEAVIERLCRGGSAPTIIVTLHRNNATADRLPAMLDWVRYLDRLGISRMRLHLLEVDSPTVAARLRLSDDENFNAFRAFMDIEPNLERLRFDLFDEMRNLLRGEDEGASCVWHPCNSYSTRGVQGVEGDGQRSNCGRTNKNGIGYVSADVVGFERQLTLYRTPQESGGCKGCRFFLMCKGNCPGTAIGGDWRLRTEHCNVLFRLFEAMESAMLAAGERPLSRSTLRPALEEELLHYWEHGVEGSLRDAVRRLGATN